MRSGRAFFETMEQQLNFRDAESGPPREFDDAQVKLCVDVETSLPALSCSSGKHADAFIETNC